MGRTSTMRGGGPVVHNVEKRPRINTDRLRSSREDSLPPPPPPLSAMQSEVQALEQHLEDLTHQLQGLGERLVPVLRPPGPNAVAELGLLDDDESTPLSRFMRAMCCKVRSLTIAVADLHARVDL